MTKALRIPRGKLIKEEGLFIRAFIALETEWRQRERECVGSKLVGRGERGTEL